MPERKLWKAIVIERLAQVSNYLIYTGVNCIFSVFDAGDCSRAVFIS